MIPSQPRSRRGLLSWVLASALLISLAANAWLVWNIKRFYARELSARLQPVATTPATTSGNPLGVRVLFLGDSRIADWPPLPADRFFTVNAGVRGETTAQIRLRTEAALQTANPAIVVVQAGINDLKAIGVLPGSASQIRSQCVANLQAIAELCRRHHARSILTTILSPGQVPLTRRLVWSHQIEDSLRGVNQSLMRQYANNEDVVVLDVDGILLAKRPNPKDFSDYRDTLHLQPAAYHKLEPDLLHLIDRLSSPQAPSRLEPPANQQSRR
jgi:lysophospholipase L1-like esterase